MQKLKLLFLCWMTIADALAEREDPDRRLQLSETDGSISDDWTPILWPTTRLPPVATRATQLVPTISTFIRRPLQTVVVTPSRLSTVALFTSSVTPSTLRTVTPSSLPLSTIKFSIEDATIPAAINTTLRAAVLAQSSTVPDDESRSLNSTTRDPLAAGAVNVTRATNATVTPEVDVTVVTRRPSTTVGAETSVDVAELLTVGPREPPTDPPTLSNATEWLDAADNSMIDLFDSEELATDFPDVATGSSSPSPGLDAITEDLDEVAPTESPPEAVPVVPPMTHTETSSSTTGTSTEASAADSGSRETSATLSANVTEDSAPSVVSLFATAATLADDDTVTAEPDGGVNGSPTIPVTTETSSRVDGSSSTLTVTLETSTSSPRLDSSTSASTLEPSTLSGNVTESFWTVETWTSSIRVNESSTTSAVTLETTTSSEEPATSSEPSTTSFTEPSVTSLRPATSSEETLTTFKISVPPLVEPPTTFRSSTSSREPFTTSEASSTSTRPSSSSSTSSRPWVTSTKAPSTSARPPTSPIASSTPRRPPSSSAASTETAETTTSTLVTSPKVVVETEATTMDVSDGLSSGQPEGTTTQKHSESDSTIIAVTVSIAAVLCMAILLLLLLVIRRRRARAVQGTCQPARMDAYSLDNVSPSQTWNRAKLRSTLRASKRSYLNQAFDDPAAFSMPLTAAQLALFMEKSTAGIEDEFGRIPPSATVRIEELPAGVEAKNRYANVLPVPETRVKIRQSDDPRPHSQTPTPPTPTPPSQEDELDHYINANYVRGPKEESRFYIACQGPLESTVADFWQMVWENQSRIVIQLTDLTENGVQRCAQYLPPSEVLDCHRLYGDYQVTLKSRELRDNYVASYVRLKRIEDNLVRHLVHFWYSSWPVTGVPAEVRTAITLLLEARKGQSKEQPAPVVVHCSPGTGRTGTLLAIDTSLRQLDSTRTIDIPRCVNRLRLDRSGSVQTKEQYLFIYKAVNYYASQLSNAALDSL